MERNVGPSKQGRVSEFIDFAQALRPLEWRSVDGSRQFRAKPEPLEVREFPVVGRRDAEIDLYCALVRDPIYVNK